MIKVSYLIKNFLLCNYPEIDKLGFIKRINKEFHDNYNIKLLYFTVRRYNLEHSNLILRNNSLNQTMPFKNYKSILRFLYFQCYI